MNKQRRVTRRKSLLFLAKVKRWQNSRVRKFHRGKIQNNIKMGGSGSLRDRQKKTRPGHMKLILRSCRNVSVDSSVFPTFSTLAQQCHLHHNKATKRRSPRRHHTGPNFTQARVDGTPNLLEDKLLRLFPAPPPHLPRASDMRGPVPDPLPPAWTHTHTRCSLGCLRFCGSFLLFGIVSSPPRLASQ